MSQHTKRTLSVVCLEINAEYKYRTLSNEPPSEDMATFHHLLAINTENHQIIRACSIFLLEALSLLLHESSFSYPSLQRLIPKAIVHSPQFHLCLFRIISINPTLTCFVSDNKPKLVCTAEEATFILISHFVSDHKPQLVHYGFTFSDCAPAVPIWTIFQLVVIDTIRVGSMQ